MWPLCRYLSNLWYVLRGIRPEVTLESVYCEIPIQIPRADSTLRRITKQGRPRRYQYQVRIQQEKGRASFPAYSVPEYLTMKNWIEMDLMESRKNFHTSPCCYVIYFDNQPVYVGSTNNLRARFLGHSFRYGYAKVVMTPWGDFDQRMKISIKYKLSKKYGDWLMIEARLIMKLQPVFNKMLKKKKIKGEIE